MERHRGRGAADVEERAHEPADPPADDGVPALLLHGVRWRSVAGGADPGLRLSARLHRVPVRVRAPAVGRVQRGVHGVRSRSGLRGRVRQTAHARGAPPKRDRDRVRPRRPRALVAGRRAAHSDHARRRHEPRRRSRRPRRPLHARSARELLRLLLGGRDRDALPHAPGGPAHADARLPDPLLRARVRAARAARGVDPRRRNSQSGDVPARDGPRLHRRRCSPRRRRVRDRDRPRAPLLDWAFRGLRNAEAAGA